MVEHHERVAQHLRDDGGACDRIAEVVSTDNRPTRDRTRRRIVAIHEHEIGLDREAGDGVPHGLQRGLSNVVPIDRVSRENANADFSVPENDFVRAPSLPHGQAF